MPILTPAILAGVGALGGVAKSELIDRPKEKRDRKLQAETARYSPWTGLRAGAVNEADPLASALSFGTAGAQLGFGMQGAANNTKIADAIAGGAGGPPPPTNMRVQGAMGDEEAMGAAAPVALAPKALGAWGGVKQAAAPAPRRFPGSRSEGLY
jgi:hypothetical protein